MLILAVDSAAHVTIQHKMTRILKSSQLKSIFLNIIERKKGAA